MPDNPETCCCPWYVSVKQHPDLTSQNLYPTVKKVHYIRHVKTHTLEHIASWNTACTRCDTRGESSSPGQYPNFLAECLETGNVVCGSHTSKKNMTVIISVGIVVSEKNRFIR
jgi:hypothetical protein